MRNKKDKKIITLSWIFTTLLLILFIPRRKYREAQVAFLFTQFITWLFGLLVSEFNLIKYPTRIFKKATKSSFTFEYFIFPALASLFNIYFPEKQKLSIRGLYYFFYTAVISSLEFYAVKRTNLIKYNGWHWSWSFITIWATYFLTRRYYKWFLQI